MSDVLLVVDVVNAFDQDDGGRLLASFRGRLPNRRAAIAECRDRGEPSSVAACS
jgi:hypothetical protein